jgi:hypothetical protein
MVLGMAMVLGMVLGVAEDVLLMQLVHVLHIITYTHAHVPHGAIPGDTLLDTRHGNNLLMQQETCGPHIT